MKWSVERKEKEKIGLMDIRSRWKRKEEGGRRAKVDTTGYTSVRRAGPNTFNKQMEKLQKGNHATLLIFKINFIKSQVHFQR